LVTSCDPDILSHDPTPVSRTAGASRRRVEWVRLFDFTRSPWVAWNSACLNALGILAGLAIAKLCPAGTLPGPNPTQRFASVRVQDTVSRSHVKRVSRLRRRLGQNISINTSSEVLTSVLATDREFRDRPAKSMKARLQTPGRKILVARSANFAVAKANLHYLPASAARLGNTPPRGRRFSPTTRSVPTCRSRRLVPGLESGPRLYSCGPRTAARGCPQWEPRRPGGGQSAARDARVGPASSGPTGSGTTDAAAL